MGYNSDMLNLTPTQRRFLRAQAHRLRPIVMIGHSGLTDTVKKEIDSSLRFHELMKITLAGDDRETRNQTLDVICNELNAAPVQQIGKILVIYRPAAEPKLTLPN